MEGDGNIAPVLESEEGREKKSVYIVFLLVILHWPMLQP